MSGSIALADLPSFSFHTNPVLVVENFWSPEERKFFREGMSQAAWKSLLDLPRVREDFPSAGNWAKAEEPPLFRRPEILDDQNGILVERE